MNGDITVLNQQIKLLRKTIPQMVAQEIVGVQPMTTPVRYNKRYWPYQYYLGFRYSYDEMADIERWCWRHFKGRFWRSDERFFAFKRQKDFNWFMLRWSK